MVFGGEIVLYLMRTMRRRRHCYLPGTGSRNTRKQLQVLAHAAGGFIRRLRKRLQLRAYIAQEECMHYVSVTA